MFGVYETFLQLDNKNISMMIDLENNSTAINLKLEQKSLSQIETKARVVTKAPCSIN